VTQKSEFSLEVLAEVLEAALAGGHEVQQPVGRRRERAAELQVGTSQRSAWCGVGGAITAHAKAAETQAEETMLV
jgi:hypothetical protein